MRAKRILVSVLSFSLCAGQLTVPAASAAEKNVPAYEMTSDLTEATPLKAAVKDTAAAAAITPTANIQATDINALGDVNNDKFIDANDASLILKTYVRISNNLASGLSFEQANAADVNKDHHIDSIDASCILSYYSYLSTNGTLSLEAYLNADKPLPVTTTASATTKATTTTTTKTTTAAPKTTTTSKITSTSTTKAVTTTSTSSSKTTNAPTTTTTTTTASTTTTTTKATTAATTTTTAATTTSAVQTTTAVTTSYVNPYKVQEIKLSKTEMTLTVGDGGGISYVTMLPQTVTDYRDVWSCSDESVAVVDNEGWIFPLSEGNCIVTVQSLNNPLVKAEIKVTVKDPNRVNSIKLSKYSMSIPIGGGDISYVTMLPANATNKKEIWKSSDESVAKVDASGWVSGISEGTCTVTVSSKSNPDVKASINVTVTDPKQVRELKLSKYEMDLLIGTTDISYVTILPTTALKQDVVWTSSNPAIASVDNWGNVYGVAAGKCVISVISKANPNIKADIAVSVHTRPVIVTSTTTT
ncbi:Ig-like domain-containing protein [Ruminococcus flavefaciens]|uniref:Ig-like domain (Group 2) n=1 Tax=Ruminococcus flavefaciens TaxID=1265 RepID=A0A1M7M3B4_RUMFL|nr:Ig-like domain-containing protein [Ruminococcus flavefaciens]SHM85180.1 Ig-like domain (group 2) [Ruminococcus flavefaciens]